MIRRNEPDGRAAPRLFLGMTTSGFVVRIGETVTCELADQLYNLIERHQPNSDMTAPESLKAEIEEALSIGAGGAVTGGGPCYRFPDSIQRLADVVQLTHANLDLARESYPWLLSELDLWWPCFAIVRDGSAVSVCFSSRIGHEAAEAGVETRIDYRGRGFASAVTAAWASSVRSSGREPIYSTAWNNAGSRAVARRSGLIMFGADATWDHSL